MRYLKYAFLIVLYYVLFSFAIQYKLIASKINISDLFLFIMTFILLSIFYYFYLNKKIRFWQVFAHEISHMLFALLFFRKITSFVVAENSGTVAYQGKGNWIITLAPYTFPLVTLVLLAFSIIGNFYTIPHKIIITISYSLYFFRLIQDFSWSQSDVERAGRVFSTLWVLGINIVIFLFIFFYLQNNFDFILKLTKGFIPKFI